MTALRELSKLCGRYLSSDVSFAKFVRLTLNTLMAAGSEVSPTPGRRLVYSHSLKIPQMPRSVSAFGARRGLMAAAEVVPPSGVSWAARPSGTEE
jgi:hypothetical protein